MPPTIPPGTPSSTPPGTPSSAARTGGTGAGLSRTASGSAVGATRAAVGLESDGATGASWRAGVRVTAGAARAGGGGGGGATRTGTRKARVPTTGGGSSEAVMSGRQRRRGQQRGMNGEGGRPPPRSARTLTVASATHDAGLDVQLRGATGRRGRRIEETGRRRASTFSSRISSRREPSGERRESKAMILRVLTLPYAKPRPEVQRRVTGRTQRASGGGARLIADGGEGGIRTHDTLAGMAVFETARFSRLRTSPRAGPHSSSLPERRLRKKETRSSRHSRLQHAGGDGEAVVQGQLLHAQQRPDRASLRVVRAVHHAIDPRVDDRAPRT